MKLKKPRFWDYKEPNFISYLLYPLSKIIETIGHIKFKNKKKFNNIRTICVGNIYIGGTGKTSLAIEIKKILDKNEINSCFIKKYYANQIDEQKLLKKFGKVFLNKSRIRALHQAELENFEVAIFDDGLQDKNIMYDISFVCFNKKNFIGNGFLIPAGPLRESLNNLSKYKNIFFNGNDEDIKPFKTTLSKIEKDLNYFDTKYNAINIEDFDLKNSYIVFSGIGNHGTFIEMLQKNNFSIIQDIEFPDHYEYSEKDINKINEIAEKKNATLLTTEKDYLRLKAFDCHNVRFIKSHLKISDSTKLEKLLNDSYKNF